MFCLFVFKRKTTTPVKGEGHEIEQWSGAVRL
jgi:hypothetical protein